MKNISPVTELEIPGEVYCGECNKHIPNYLKYKYTGRLCMECLKKNKSFQKTYDMETPVSYCWKHGGIPSADPPGKMGSWGIRLSQGHRMISENDPETASKRDRFRYLMDSR